MQNKRKVRVAPELEGSIDEILGPDELMTGSMAGLLEAINIHARANVFKIYPIAGPDHVICHFKEDQKSAAKMAVGRKVSIEGMFRYKSRDRFPFEVSVSDLEIYPTDDELPTIFDLRGIGQGATAQESSENFISRMREDGW